MARLARIAILSDRSAVTLRGPDALPFLQGLVTNDLAGLEPGRAMHAGLLNPQGKILFDFIVTKLNDGTLALDVARDKAADLAKRLTLYKLRANLEIADGTGDHGVVAVWNPTPDLSLAGSVAHFAPDPRLSALGWRGVFSLADKDSVLRLEGAESAPESAYHDWRVGLGVPEGGKDFPFGDSYPHEALFDVLNGVSFTKGCYVGQEVVSRMQHRGTAKRRVALVSGNDPLVSGTPVMAGDLEVGTIGSVSGSSALALLRLDRASEAAEKGIALRAAASEVTLGAQPQRFQMASHP